LNAIDYEYSDGKIWLALITFLYVDISAYRPREFDIRY
jgi:hypothetical protein